ncbi:sensor histidine kinase [Formosa maritima]|uniref:histidine kinase n=1 Tax=Formosa maritima TaxID=2592046 RepID=A0A5D0GLR2_9FLAO|nr:histidine kinase [Formosa maritima]TYA59279.1 histidine kinase [Formosa maritima]
MIHLINIFLQTQPSVSTSAERYLLIYMIVVLLIVTTLVVIFFIVFQKRKNKLLLDKIRQQQAFDEEIAQTQTEIQEETLKHVGRELHDNVGQLLAFASMQINMLTSQVHDDLKEKVTDTSKVIKESLQEVRALSKSLNTDVILNAGFEESIQNELNRLKRLKLMEVELISEGEKDVFKNNKDAIILFRIIQEFMSNSVKYSKAKHLNISLNYSEEMLIIQAKDDGIGFDMETVKNGAGLINMKSRAELIESKFSLTSKPNEGVQLQIEYPILKRAIND